MRAAVVMIVYAAAVVLMGLWAFRSAPAGASAWTALLVPLVIAVLMTACAWLAWSGRGKRRAGRVGVYAGLVLTLLFAGAIGHRTWAASRAVADYRSAARQFEEETGLTPAASPEQWKHYALGVNKPDHDKTYLRNTLAAMTAASVLAFAGILATRPRVRGGTGNGASDEA